MALIWIAAVMLAGAGQEMVVQSDDQMQRIENGPLNDADAKLVRQTLPGMTDACAAKVRAGGMKAMPDRTEECFEMTSSQRWKGLWLAAFEDSQFCPSPATRCDYVVRRQRKEALIWLRFSKDGDAEFKKARGGLYAVEFIGRRTKVPGRFGHMGVFDEEIVVDRMISIERVEATGTK